MAALLRSGPEHDSRMSRCAASPASSAAAKWRAGDVFVPAATPAAARYLEALVIEHARPLWNAPALAGFGSKDQGGGWSIGATHLAVERSAPWPDRQFSAVP